MTFKRRFFAGDGDDVEKSSLTMRNLRFPEFITMVMVSNGQFNLDGKIMFVQSEMFMNRKTDLREKFSMN